MWIGLRASAFFDTVLSATSWRAPSPRVYASGIVSSRDPPARFRVRRGTDDIYSVLPRREGDVDGYIRSRLGPADTFVDVGANVGYYTVAAGKLVGPRGRVVAVEPIPETFAVLTENIALNRLTNVTALAMACSAVRATGVMIVPQMHYGLASFTPSLRGNEVRVETCPLDDLTGELASVRLLKIDVEGSELSVLRGASETLSKAEFVVAEVTRDEKAVWELLERHSFSLQRSRDYPAYLFAEKAGIART